MSLNEGNPSFLYSSYVNSRTATANLPIHPLKPFNSFKTSSTNPEAFGREGLLDLRTVVIRMGGDCIAQNGAEYSRGRYVKQIARTRMKCRAELYFCSDLNEPIGVCLGGFVQAHV